MKKQLFLFLAAFLGTLWLESGNSWLDIDIAAAQTPSSPPTTGTNVPNPLTGSPPASMNYGPPFRLDNTGVQAVYRSGGNLPIAIVGHFDITSGAAPPTYVSGGGGSASFDLNAQDSSFRVTTGGGASTSVVVAWGNSPSKWSAAPRCLVSPQQGTTTNVFAVPTTSQVTLNWTGSVASAVFDVICVGTRLD